MVDAPGDPLECWATAVAALVFDVPVYDFADRPLPRHPTDAHPGSDEKLGVLGERAARLEQLHHPLDPHDSTGGDALFALVNGRLACEPAGDFVARADMALAVRHYRTPDGRELVAFEQIHAARVKLAPAGLFRLTDEDQANAFHEAREAAQAAQRATA